MVRISKSGQVWVETVVYTLVGLAVIGLLLAVAKPKIDSIRDKMVIEQSMDALNTFSDTIFKVQRAPGNRRVVDLKVSQGKMVFDLDHDMINWSLPSDYQFSQPDVIVPIGSLNVLTKTGGSGSDWLVVLSMSYAIDLQYGEQTTGVKEINSAPMPYSLKVENLGEEKGNIVVQISE